MNTEQHTKQFFLWGISGTCLLLVAGLVWAIVVGPRSSEESRGEARAFRDEVDPALGPRDTKAVVHIYGDFQCPACAIAEKGLTYARKTYQDRVRFVWKDFPLISIHHNALTAASAARCAQSQGKFWEYHDKLYDTQSAWASLSDPTHAFREYAQGVGLDLEAFTSCVAERRFEQRVRDNLAEARENSVQATPTFFIGKKRVAGALQPAEWDRELQMLVQ